MEPLKHLLSYARRALEDYDMIQPGDRVAVGVSAGKDSLTLLYALAELRRFYPVPFSLCAITVDMGFDPPADLSPIRAFCEKLDVPYHVVPSDIAKVVFDIRKESNPCSLCAKMRRGALHGYASEIGCNVVALGHHFDDVVETTLMAMLHGGQIQAMPPKLHSTNFEGMELIRPLYLIREKDIKHWRDYNGLHFLQCACKFTDTCSSCNPDNMSKRQETKRLIESLEKTNPRIKNNIFRSIHNVNLDTLIVYKTNGEKHSFLEKYGGENNGI